MVEKLNEAYVMTGTLYEREMPNLSHCDESHKIPSGYWKIVCHENKYGYINTVAFIFDQNTRKHSKIQDHVKTINELEERSGLDFLWMLDDKKETEIESSINQE